MGENSKIEWCDHTFNPWVGCTKIAPPCDFCYAESWAKRTGHPELWNGERRRTSTANWKEPHKWAKRAAADGVQRRVFCASLADVWDNQVPAVWRRDLFDLIWATRESLDWLLLTKRPMNIADMLGPATAGVTVPWPWPNVWLGTTCGDRSEYERNWAHLRLIPAAVQFISYEPALGPMSMFPFPHLLGGNEQGKLLPDWIICGGESGGNARPMHPAWARSLRDECEHHGVAFFFKQWGEWAPFWYRDDGAPKRKHTFDNGVTVYRIGNGNAGRALDNREHNDFPPLPRYAHNKTRSEHAGSSA